MSKVITFNPESRENLIKGINILADAVGVTLGPKGRNVIVDTYGVPSTTKDGVTVAKYITLIDPIQNIGAQVIKQAASKTADIAGDGTTTATVLAQALINNSNELILKGYSPIDIKRKFDDYLTLTLDEISKLSIPLTQDKLESIATISANNDPYLGKIISDAFIQVGKDGAISVEDSRTGSTYTKIIEGYNFNTGYLSPYFVNKFDKSEVVLENPYILVTDKKIRGTDEIIPVMEAAHRENRALAVICDEIEAQALSVVIVNKLRFNLPLVVIKAPAYGERRYEMLRDIATVTGAKYISDTTSDLLNTVTTSQLGKCSKIIVSKTETTIVDPKGSQEDIDNRVSEIQGLLETETQSYVIEKLKERLAKLISKVAVIYVGAATETEGKEIKDRIDDAIRAVRSSVVKGYVEGAGHTLVRVSNTIKSAIQSSRELDDIDNAYFESLLHPSKLIRSNAGVSQEDLLTPINSLTGNQSNLIEDGIIDPTLVVEQGIINAVSVSNMITLSEVTIYDTKEKYSPPSPDDVPQS